MSIFPFWFQNEPNEGKGKEEENSTQEEKRKGKEEKWKNLPPDLESDDSTSGTEEGTDIVSTHSAHIL